MSYPTHITNIYELLNEDGDQNSVRVNVGDNKSSNQTRGGQTASSSRGNAQGGAKPQGARDGQRRTGENRPPRQDNRGPRSIDGRKPNEVPVGGDFSQAVPSRRERPERTRDSAHRSSERRARNADQVGELNGRRVFDRRSGTGRGREQKKGGAGRGNWGKEGEETTASGENWDTTEESKEAPKEEKVEEVPEEKTPEQLERERIAKEEQEKEDKLLTLDAYLKQKEATAAKITLPEARKANEGVDQKELNKWSGYAVLKKDEDDTFVSKSVAEEKKGKNTVPLDQVFNVREPARPRPEREDRPFRGSRGGRGGNRGGRGGNRGGNRSGRGGESAPNFDLNSFPTLAPKA